MLIASLTDSPRRPNGKTTYLIAQDRQEYQRNPENEIKEENQQKLVKQVQPGVDSEGRWVKKKGRLHYGFKKHIATNLDGLVTAVHTTTDRKGLKSLIKKTPNKKVKKGVFADKGYKVPVYDEFLEENKIKNRIQHKAYRNRPLTQW